MVLWNFDLLWKTMVLWKKLWYYGPNYGTILRTIELRFTKKKKNMADYQMLRNFDLKWKKLWKYTKINEVLNRLIALEF